MRQRTDCEFLLEVLADGDWHSTSEILRRSILERGHGMTVHSRVSDLRKKRGLLVEHRRVEGERADAFQYRLACSAASEPCGDSSEPGAAAAAPADRAPRTKESKRVSPDAPLSTVEVAGSTPAPRSRFSRSADEVLGLLAREDWREATEREVAAWPPEDEQTSIFDLEQVI